MNEHDQVIESEPLDTITAPLPDRQRPLFETQLNEAEEPRQQWLGLPHDSDGCHNSAVLECRDNLDFLREQPNNKFKLIVTSPPYNIGKSYESRSPLDHYLADQKEVIRECVRVLHPEGSICWQVGNFTEKGEILPLDCLLFPIFREFGLKLRNRIVWHFLFTVSFTALSKHTPSVSSVEEPQSR